MREHGLSFDSVSRALTQNSIDVPGGVARTTAGETLIRTTSKARDGKQFDQIEIVSSPNGSSVQLKDIANVKDAFEDKVLYTTFQDEPAVTLRIFRVGKQSPLDISKKVSNYVEKRSKTLPGDIKMTIWQDSSYYLQGRLDMMIRNAQNGLILVFLVLSFFLRPSLAFFVALGLPISFMGAFATMGVIDASINLVCFYSCFRNSGG
jgi:multidrug efflux pump subunit AcrB